MSDDDALIIGAGNGGMTAALKVANAGKKVLLMEKHNIPGGQSGECSLCRTKLLSGKIYHHQGVKLRKSDRDFSYIHPCLAYQLEDLQLMI